MKTIEELLKDLEVSFNWNIKSACSMSEQKRLNPSEILGILQGLGKAEMCALIIDKERGNKNLITRFNKERIEILTNIERNKERTA